ncbi:ArnT family glycosyltransferase [Bryobacter aggregatus]|uniref:ArnT family glycosyltransferase n=1 Tax=Bryobacter aggregatus TaxID=360054 RepID=UPI0004E175F3|nr:hypothetical protein [Bryobacter aggregatus]
MAFFFCIAQMTSPARPSLRLPAILVFSITSCLTWFLTAHLLSPSIDEGIYLQGGHRLLQGQIPYVDFFAFTGPIIYWTEAVFEFFFGRNIPFLRLPVAISIGMIATGILCLVHRIASLRAGLCAVALWFTITMDLWNRLEVNHRWLSMAFYSAAAVCFFSAQHFSRRNAALAGAFLSLACWTTQSFVWPLLIITIYLAIQARQYLLPFLTGAMVAGTIPLIVLTVQGALLPMIENMKWVIVNYAEANRVGYGYYFNEIPLHYLPHILLSVWLPPIVAALGLLLILLRKQQDLIFPLLFVVAVFPTALPKWDALQLMFLMGPFLGMAIAMIWKQLPEALLPPAQATLLMPAVFLLVLILSTFGKKMDFDSRAGKLVGDEHSIASVQSIYAAIPEGSTLFAYPYFTALYPLLHAENPTRYEFLQPGMMTAQDEQQVLADLHRKPPQFIFWFYFSDSEILKIWPNTNPARLHFKNIEEFILHRYEPEIEILTSNFTGKIWKLKSP